jgi:hypothetical protein
MMPVDVEGNRQELAVEAMEGDVIVKLMLVRHFKQIYPGITRQNLHDLCQARLTNDLLALNYVRLTQANDLPDLTTSGLNAMAVWPCSPSGTHCRHHETRDWLRRHQRACRS